MNNYELMVIFTPVLSDEEFKAEQKKYATIVKNSGGSGSRKCLGTEITRVSHPEKNYRSLLGPRIHCAVRL
jgi:hypothetical protein